MIKFIVEQVYRKSVQQEGNDRALEEIEPTGRFRNQMKASLDTERAFWTPVPQAHLIIARPHGPVEMLPFPEVARVAAE